MASVSRFDEKLCLFDAPARAIKAGQLVTRIVSGQQVVGKLAPGVGVEEQLGVDKQSAKVIDDLLGLFDYQLFAAQQAFAAASIAR